MSKVTFKRWAAGMVFSIIGACALLGGCVIVAVIVGWCFRLLGVG